MFNPLKLKLGCGSKDDVSSDSVVQRLGSTIAGIPRSTGIIRTETQPGALFRFLPASWVPARSTILKAGVVIFAVTAAWIILRRLSGRLLSGLD